LFNYNRNKLTLQALANTGTQQLLTTSRNQIFYPGETWTQQLSNHSNNKIWSAGLGASYQFTRSWTSGFKYLGSFTNNTSDNAPLTTRFNTTTQTVQSYITSASNASSKPIMHSLNWYHTFELDSTGKNITVDFDYFNYRKNDYRFFSGNERSSDRIILPGTFFSSFNGNNNRVRNYSGNIDVSLPYRKGTISFGARAASTHTSNDLQVLDYTTGEPVFNTAQSNLFQYQEYNEALYGSFNRKLSTKWEIQLGLRAEATQTEGYSKNLNQTNKNNYVQLFPTAYITHVRNEQNSFSLNYSRRIRRPDFDYLNPFVIRTSPYYYSEGNPFLKPAIMDNIEFGYTHNQKWVNTVYFLHVSGFAQELAIVDAATNITRSTPLNYANTSQTGISSYYNFNKWSWWQSFTGFNVNYQYVHSKTSFVESIGGYNSYIYTNNDFTLNAAKSLFLGVNYAVQLPGRYQIFQIGTLHMLDVSVKVLLLDKKLALTVVGEDLLNAQKPLITYYSNGIQNNVKSYQDTRGCRISISYKLGNNNLHAKQRSDKNEEERNRLK
jgi:hypothetical protein